MKILGMALMLAGLSTFAFAIVPVGDAPEIGMGSAGSALALLSGTLLVIRSRSKK